MKVAVGLGILIASVLSGIAAVVAFYPPAAAAVCPTCYGLVPTGINIYSESQDEWAAARALDIVETARQQVRYFYGSLESNPRILICFTEACYKRIGGGGSTGMALLDFALLLSPRGDRTVIATHEMSHIELHERLGLWRTVRRRVPQWFDEGLAVLISDDRRYLRSPAEADRCIVKDAEDLPTDRSAWVVEARNHRLYAKAACRVYRWTVGGKGTTAVLELISRVRAGEAFRIVFTEVRRPGGASSP